eukprot:364308-Chlamydomonas_euryale.AAC.14
MHGHDENSPQYVRNSPRSVPGIYKAKQSHCLVPLQMTYATGHFESEHWTYTNLQMGLHTHHALCRYVEKKRVAVSKVDVLRMVEAHHLLLHDPHGGAIGVIKSLFVVVVERSTFALKPLLAIRVLDIKLQYQFHAGWLASLFESSQDAGARAGMVRRASLTAPLHGW